MTYLLILLGSAVGLGLAVAYWRLAGPGKRIRVGALTLYYARPLTAGVATRVAEYLVRENFSAQGMDARVTREGATYQLQLICPGQPTERQVIACEVLAAGLSDDVFAGAAVEVQVCDTILRPSAVIRHRGRFGRRITMNAAHLFYLEGVTDARALEVAAFLAGMGVFDDSPKVAQMNCSPEGYEFRLAVDVDPLGPELVAGARQMASDLRRVLKAPVAVQFCPGLLGALRAVQPRATEPGAEGSHVPGGPYRTKIYCVPGERPNEDTSAEPGATTDRPRG